MKLFKDVKDNLEAEMGKDVWVITGSDNREHGVYSSKGNALYEIVNWQKTGGYKIVDMDRFNNIKVFDGISENIQVKLTKEQMEEFGCGPNDCPYRVLSVRRKTLNNGAALVLQR